MVSRWSMFHHVARGKRSQRWGGGKKLNQKHQTNKHKHFSSLLDWLHLSSPRKSDQPEFDPKHFVVQWVRFAWLWLTPASCSCSHSSPWGLHIEPRASKTTGRGVKWQCGRIKMMLFWLFFPLSPLPLAKPVSPGVLISSSGWQTGAFYMDSEHSLKEQETSGKQCGKQITESTIFVRIQQWSTVVNGQSQNWKWLLFFPSQIWKNFFLFLQQLYMNLCLFFSSHLFSSTRARLQNPYARDKYCISSLNN